MNRKLLMACSAATLLLGGYSLSQFIGNSDQYEIQNTALKDLPNVAYKLSSSTITSLSGDGSSAPQVTQVQSEVNTQLQLIQIRQNAEIIRLLSVIAAKK